MTRSLQVLHSTEFQDVKMAEGKRVVVVGNGKSAVDCAVEASKAPGRGKRNTCISQHSRHSKKERCTQTDLKQ